MILGLFRYGTEHYNELRADLFRERHDMLDEQFRLKAREESKAVTFLESDEESVKVLKCVEERDEEIAKKIRSILIGEDLLAQSSKNIKNLVAAYRSGSVDDITAKEEFISGERRTHDCMIKNRNLQWLPKFESLMRTHSQPFIAVGVLHFENRQDSLIELLKSDGYSVSRLE